jgi:hypothetical protein
VPRGDALDALACAWSARRFAAGEHEFLDDGVDPTAGRLHGIVI